MGANAGGPRLAGAFAVANGQHEDRLIADRRTRNQVEAAMPKQLLPQAARLRRLRLGPGQVIEAHARDQRHCFYMYAAPDSRLDTQVLGPCIPRSWAYDLQKRPRAPPSASTLGGSVIWRAPTGAHR